MPTNSELLGENARVLLPHAASALSLTGPQMNKLVDRVYCFSFKVRMPRADYRSCNKTPYFDRWDVGETSYLTPDDPKYGTQEQCEQVAAVLIAQLFETDGAQYNLDQVPRILEILGRAPGVGNLVCQYREEQITAEDIRRAMGYSTQRLGSYDVPITYRTELNEGGLHRSDNVTWMKPVHINYKLRENLKQEFLKSGATNQAAKNAMDKIQVKAYCTDKVTMPPHFSNRDIRWATWHESHQYASHYECAMIELELMAQLYEFHGGPELQEDLAQEVAQVRGRPIQPNSRKCYITGRDMDYNSYLQGAVTPQGGRSAYHVGHVIPLTRGGHHAWQNVAWIGDDGNRIQGNDTIEEIEQKLIDAVEYHLRRDLANGSKNLEATLVQLWGVLNDIREAHGRPRINW